MSRTRNSQTEPDAAPRRPWWSVFRRPLASIAARRARILEHRQKTQVPGWFAEALFFAITCLGIAVPMGFANEVFDDLSFSTRPKHLLMLVVPTAAAFRLIAHFRTPLPAVVLLAALFAGGTHMGYDPRLGYSNMMNLTGNDLRLAYLIAFVNESHDARCLHFWVLWLPWLCGLACSRGMSSTRRLLVCAMAAAVAGAGVFLALGLISRDPEYSTLEVRHWSVALFTVSATFPVLAAHWSLVDRDERHRWRRLMVGAGHSAFPAAPLLLGAAVLAAAIQSTSPFQHEREMETGLDWPVGIGFSRPPLPGARNGVDLFDPSVVIGDGIIRREHESATAPYPGSISTRPAGRPTFTPEEYGRMQRYWLGAPGAAARQELLRRTLATATSDGLWGSNPGRTLTEFLWEQHGFYFGESVDTLALTLAHTGHPDLAAELAWSARELSHAYSRRPAPYPRRGQNRLSLMNHWMPLHLYLTLRHDPELGPRVRRHWARRLDAMLADSQIEAEAPRTAPWALFLPNPVEDDRSWSRMDAYTDDGSLQLLRIVLAMDDYRAAHGVFPDRLDDLAPEVIPVVPRHRRDWPGSHDYRRNGNEAELCYVPWISPVLALDADTDAPPPPVLLVTPPALASPASGAPAGS